ncbi:MAG TPA: hypothetical protein P5320_07420 [Bacteroidales bacterium]|nr:hypothetical protein [Bacteroidales bacterium]HOM41011.1 hypothetical protein [Bacteroidales bacterium]HPP92616.1 hypothetical protein [Bacteroidales bacterium]HRR16541.1 hypothetical protein [Bacteroidales bacterium]HRU57064.1 hypothetical protein [Bacteroidales bacterium]
MKKSVVILFSIAFIVFSVNAQKVTSYTYKLANGITVKMEKAWPKVWVQQTQEAFSASEQPQSVVVNMRIMGELTKGHTFKLTSGGKDVRLKDASPGTYDLKINSALSGSPGNIVTDITGVVVKPKMKTSVNVTIYDYQINIEESPLPAKGLASWDFKVNRYKGNNDQTYNQAVPTFYAKGARDKTITPDESSGKSSGKIKPGAYDVLVTVEIPGYNQKIWLENFTMKADVSYKVSINMNAGEVMYAGTSREVTKLHLYPSGTSDKMQGVAKPDRSLEFLVVEPATAKFPCMPGTYDVLINYGNKKYEWRKGIIVRTGTITTVK